jgi:acetylornithine deacetylase/succinyl-diaminopimelate desuccinylase-like protein
MSASGGDERTTVQVPGLTRDERRELQRETIALLARLLQADTTNPPGNETRAALVLQEYFAGHGLDAQLVGDLPDRQNLIVRLSGARRGPRLGLLGHLDVVPAEADEWTLPPFCGAVRDGYVWGRGATDMKNQVAAQAVAVTRLARAGAPFAGELLFMATADEERGDYCGARWLVRQRPDLVRCDYLLNEGGGTYSVVDGTRLYPLTVGEKAFADFRITVRGPGGHGSVPQHDHNPVERLGRVISAIADHEAAVFVAPFTARYIDRLVADRRLGERLKDPAQARAAIRELHATDPESACEIEPLLGITFSPTILHGGGAAVNVIPSHASVDIDCRILPGYTGDDVRREVDAALAGIDGWEFAWTDLTDANESPVPTPLSAAVERVMDVLVPGAEVIPLHLCGFTDSRWFREAFPDIVAYGFCPFVAEDTATMGGREHARDERIAVEDVPFQTRFFELLVGELLA